MSTEPTFAGEVQFRRYSDTSTQGQQIVLQVEDREALRPFIGLEGKRFMAVLVAIGDDEQPIPPPTPRKQRMGAACEWLVMRCKDREFREWLYHRFSPGPGNDTEERAAEICREVCDVEKRSQIDGNLEAEQRFEAHIRKPWMARPKQPA